MDEVALTAGIELLVHLHDALVIFPTAHPHPIPPGINEIIAPFLKQAIASFRAHLAVAEKQRPAEGHPATAQKERRRGTRGGRRKQEARLRHEASRSRPTPSPPRTGDARRAVSPPPPRTSTLNVDASPWPRAQAFCKAPPRHAAHDRSPGASLPEPTPPRELDTPRPPCPASSASRMLPGGTESYPGVRGPAKLTSAPAPRPKPRALPPRPKPRARTSDQTRSSPIT